MIIFSDRVLYFAASVSLKLQREKIYGTFFVVIKSGMHRGREISLLETSAATYTSWSVSTPCAALMMSGSCSHMMYITRATAHLHTKAFC